MFSALNACGFDLELSASDPIRGAVRAEVARATAGSTAAAAARDQLCQFFADHRRPDAVLDLAQYVSLALNLEEPPEFAVVMKTADLPPDAAGVLGVIPYLQRFYEETGLAKIWARHRPQYEQQVTALHQPLSQMLTATEAYLRMPIQGYLGRRFIVFVERLGAPGQVNARNYGSNYFVVVTPARGAVRMDSIRHAYLHYILDPVMSRRAGQLLRLRPLLETVQAAPMDESFKQDIGLLVTESLIQAIEARTLGDARDEAEKTKAAEDAVAQGYILARYFHQALARFERGEVGFQDAFADMLHELPLEQERKRAERVQFASNAVPEVLLGGSPRPGSQPLDVAEERLAGGDLAGARQIAQEALARQQGDDAGRALFILARVATLERDVNQARQFFERTVAVSREPRLRAWSHIYLGRILDLQEEREAALQHYRQALDAGDPLPDTRAAAERGLQQPYQPVRAPQP